MKELLEKLENNSFIEKVRMNFEFNVKNYQELLRILNEIKHYTYNHNLIEKRLASNLYEIPKLTHIWYLNLKDDPNKNESSIVNQLEDAGRCMDRVRFNNWGRNSWSRTINPS